MKNCTCYGCIYFDNACCHGSVDRTKPCESKVTEEKDRKETANFFKNLIDRCKGTAYRWEIFTDEISQVMGISLVEAEMWERKIVRYGISERQNGGLVTNA